MLNHLGATRPDELEPVPAAAGDDRPEVHSPGEAVFVQFIGTDVAAIEQEYRRFIRERLIAP
jgi:hypothetical protein